MSFDFVGALDRREALDEGSALVLSRSRLMALLNLESTGPLIIDPFKREAAPKVMSKLVKSAKTKST